MTDYMTTWRQELEFERKPNFSVDEDGERVEDGREADESPIVAVAPDEATLDEPFDWSDGEAPAILIWTEERVYFPVTYDYAVRLASAPRNPQPEGQLPAGGGGGRMLIQDRPASLPMEGR